MRRPPQRHAAASWPGPLVDPDAAAEGGYCRRAGHLPALFLVHVEPDEAEQPVGAGAGEQVSDFAGLVRARRGGLGDEDGIVGQLPHGLDGWTEQRRERPGRLGVITVDADPGHVRITRPPGGGWVDATP